jgi:Fe-S oxidoreductase
VLHHSEVLSELIVSGQLRRGRQLGYRVTYHDPCYLGRYNGVYDAPRQVIAATGCRMLEMPRHGDRSLCCGAGGGRIWMEEGQQRERASEARIREAAALDVGVLVVACPKCVTMYRDAIKTAGYEDRLVVKELGELVHEALDATEAPATP